MTDTNGQKDNLENAAQEADVRKSAEPRVSKPYVMPDDPEETVDEPGSVRTVLLATPPDDTVW